MITFVRAFSAVNAAKVIDGTHDQMKDFKGRNIAWIGITDPWSYSPVGKEPKALLLAFDAQNPDGSDGFNPTRPFTEELATQIVTFVDDLEKSQTEYSLFIHCEGGVTRSASIAGWVADTYHVEGFDSRFSRLALHILFTLRRAYKKHIAAT